MLNTVRLGELYNCNRTTISDVLDRNNIVKRKGKLTLEQRDQIKIDYLVVQSQRKLAQQYGVDKKTISNVLKS